VARSWHKTHREGGSAAAKKKAAKVGAQYACFRKLANPQTARLDNPQTARRKKLAAVWRQLGHIHV
jgi:hypothetical protein